MAGLRRTLDELARYHRKMTDAASQATGGDPESNANRLRETIAFGSDPGNLRMLSYVPDTLPPGAALVVVLHGCTQTAAGYDSATGWSQLADRFGFALLYPEQRRDNNPNGCFNWFQPADISRGGGEALSIRQMIDQMVTDHGLDRQRVTITGLSAGGAMAAVMLATYPELFAAGAIIAGLPYGGADSLQQALESMRQGRGRPAPEWARLVHRASSHAGPWPKIAIWHGDADATVLPINADELIKQWTAVHGLSPHPTAEGKLDGFPFRAWSDRAGNPLVTNVTLTGMGHGTPISPRASEADRRYGHPAPFILDHGISSTYHIASAWGLTDASAERAVQQLDPSLSSPHARVSPAFEGPRATQAKWTSRFNPSTVIHDALRAAGLMK